MQILSKAASQILKTGATSITWGPETVMAVVPAPKTPLKLNTMTLHREGEIYWKIIPGTFHCGTAAAIHHGKLAIRYQLTAQCAPKLDAHGFLFDQVQIDSQLTAFAKKPTGLSCEELTQFAAESLLAWLAKTAPSCEVKRLSLRLSPAPFKASATAFYEAP